ncbi:MAG: O-antigen ligase family protein, partial [Bacteroidota bacterium]
MKANPYLLIALIYFFFNSWGLPEGLLYTIVLTPLFYYWVHVKGARQVLTGFVLLSLPFALIHLLQGVALYYYFKSLVLLFTVYVFTYAVHIFFKRYPHPERIFRWLLIANFVAVLVAIVLFFTPWRELLWTVRNLTVEIKDFPRLQLLTYEPSYYSTLLVPIVLYYVAKLLFEPHDTKTTIAYLVLMLLPLLLSFSLGVLGTLGAVMVLFFLLHFKRLLVRRHVFYSLSSVILLTVVTLVALWVFVPDNPLYERVGDLFAGKDTSGRGRTVEALKLATLVADTKSRWFGVGVGQVKVAAEVVIRDYYHYTSSDIPVIRIPSAIGETIGTFGFVGLVLRFGLQAYL